jgi:hypothetical protein
MGIRGSLFGIIVAAAIFFFPSRANAGTGGQAPSGSTACNAGSPQIVLQNRSKWLLALISNSDLSQTPPPFIRPNGTEVWCVGSAEGDNSIAYSVNANSGSIITYSVSGGSLTSISVLPEGGPPTAYCSISAGTNAAQPMLVLTYYDQKPNASAVFGVCSHMTAGS